MRLKDGLSRAHRVVIVIALGIALSALGRYLVSLGGGGPRFGWYAYSPQTAQRYRPRAGMPTRLRLIIWLGLTGLWALASLAVLRRPSDRPARPAG